MVDSIKIQPTSFITQNTGNIKDFYKITTCVGRGAYGEVRKCLHKETNVLRAVKIINKKELEEDQKAKLLNEIEILKQMDHPNILKLYEFFQDDKRYFLVTELCYGGELFEKITENTLFSEKDAAHLLLQILSALNYCHSMSIVHRDLKPENILIDKDKITIIDFGTSCKFDKGKKMSQKFGTPYYIAPEVLKGQYDEKCDIWSAGVILYILLCGYPPFNGDTDRQIIEAVIRGKFSFAEPEWKQISQEAKDLVKLMLTFDPVKRISAADALQHKWIQKFMKYEKVEESVATQTLANLRNFRIDLKLKQATLAFMASQLVTEEEKDQLQKIFRALDKNGDGHLSKQEILDGYEEYFGVPIEEGEVDRMFKQIDLDGNGCIDYTEFVMATMNEKNILTSDKLQQAFKVFDKDGSGTISPIEIREVLGYDSSINPVVLEDIIKQVDINGDGEIQYDEFVVMMKRLAIHDKQI